MPQKPMVPGSSARVSSKVFFRIKKSTTRKRKGQIVSAAYAARYPHLVSQEKWLYLHTLRHGLDAKTRKEKTWWAITERAKLTTTEKILPVKAINDRHIHTTLTRSRAFNKLWENDRGEIRVTVNGIAEGKRIKEVIHLGFLKKAWESRHNGYAQFKQHLVGAIISNLRRRGLRLSNSKESAKRISGLKKKQADLLQQAQYTEGDILGGIMEQVKWTAQAIPVQKDSTQLTRATIRIEKMV